MKKTLPIIIALVLINLSVFPTSAFAAEQRSIDHFIGETEYKKVTSSELTPAVVEQILKEYPTSKLAAVYKNSKGQFKLIMVLQSGTRRTVYIDQYGRWFQPKR